MISNIEKIWTLGIPSSWKNFGSMQKWWHHLLSCWLWSLPLTEKTQVTYTQLLRLKWNFTKYTIIFYSIASKVDNYSSLYLCKERCLKEGEVYCGGAAPCCDGLTCRKRPGFLPHICGKPGSKNIHNNLINKSRNFYLYLKSSENEHNNRFIFRYMLEGRLQMWHRKGMLWGIEV